MRALHRLLTPPALLLLLLPLLLLLSPAAGQQDGNKAAADLLPTATVAAIHRGIAAGTFTCQQLIEEQLRRVDAYNGLLHAFIFVRREQAMAEARAADSAGAGAALRCVPVVVKDNIDVQAVATTNGALAFANMTAPSDSGVVQKIRAAGGIVIGKANMAEMSDSGTDSNSTVGGLCGNPWNPKRSCLGSSGGSSAAVAAGLSVIGIGTDTEGSVIGPCTAAGLLCMRPSQTAQFESVMTGVYPAFQKQDMVGLMARNSEDFLLAFDVVYGTNYTSTLKATDQLNGIGISVLQNFYENFTLGPVSYQPDANMVSMHRDTLQKMQQLGAQLQNYTLAPAELGAKLGQIITDTDTKKSCSRSCMKQDLDNYFRRYSTSGPYRNAEDLVAASSLLPTTYQTKLNYTVQQAAGDVCNSNSNTSCLDYIRARTSITAILTEMMGNASVLAMPFTAKLPQLNGEVLPLGDQIGPALNPYSGWPSLALPVGFSPTGTDQSKGLPIAMVLMAKTGQEQLLAKVANAYLARHAVQKTPGTTPALEVKSATTASAGAIVMVAAAAVAAAAGSAF